MSDYYIFFTRNTLPQPDAAHLVHDVNTANGAANLGYPALLVYLRKQQESFNLLDCFAPFKPQKPSQHLADFYQIHESLQVLPLAMPWPINEQGGKWINPSTYICKYFFPVHLFRHTKILHTLDWNLVKTAIKSGIPVIYEREHYQKSKYDPEIVNHPLFQVAVTVADPIKNNMIENGMPAEKIVKLHLGFNQSFLKRYPEQSQKWREQLLHEKHQKLILYSGALYEFKGVDLLLEVAQKLHQHQFVFAGGNNSQVNYYQNLAQDKQLNNVRFLGYLNHQYLPSLLQSADLLVHPHCSGEASTFTSPLKFFEYLASGVPIVATEILPLQEFKSAQITVNWCEPDDPIQLANCIQETLEHYPRKSEGYPQQIKFAQQFSWEARVEKIMNHIDSQFHPPKK